MDLNDFEKETVDMSEDGITTIMLQVNFNNDSGMYEVIIPQGSSVGETAFCVSVIMKCLARDGVCSTKEFLEYVNKYLDDPQYEEVQS